MSTAFEFECEESRRTARTHTLTVRELAHYSIASINADALQVTRQESGQESGQEVPHSPSYSLPPLLRVCIVILVSLVSVFAYMGWIVSVPECVAQVGFRFPGGLHSELLGFLSVSG